jgi:hypothetical protein
VCTHMQYGRLRCGMQEQEHLFVIEVPDLASQRFRTSAPGAEGNALLPASDRLIRWPWRNFRIHYN